MDHPGHPLATPLPKLSNTWHDYPGFLYFGPTIYTTFDVSMFHLWWLNNTTGITWQTNISKLYLEWKRRSLHPHQVQILRPTRISFSMSIDLLKTIVWTNENISTFMSLILLGQVQQCFANLKIIRCCIKTTRDSTKSQGFSFKKNQVLELSLLFERKR